MKAKKSATKEASCRRITTKADLIDWLSRLPYEVKTGTMMKLIEIARTADFVLWQRGLGFRVW